jgi:hypothetical protein
MKPVVLTVSIPATILSCQVNADHEVAERPAQDIPELQALDRYAGHWEDEIDGRPGVKRTEFGEWILQGRFLRQSWKTESSEGVPAASGMTLMTFDTERKTFRSWAFLATGSVIENEGVWEPVTKTFTWGHYLTDSSETVITKASFVDAETQSWSIAKTDSHGKLVREVTGKNIRRNPALMHAA